MIAAITSAGSILAEGGGAVSAAQTVVGKARRARATATCRRPDMGLPLLGQRSVKLCWRGRRPIVSILTDRQRGRNRPRENRYKLLPAAAAAGGRISAARQWRRATAI